jgi:hypothetical protein
VLDGNINNFIRKYLLLNSEIIWLIKIKNS